MFAYVTLALMVVGSFYFPESINTRTEAYKLLFYFVFEEEKKSSIDFTILITYSAYWLPCIFHKDFILKLLETH